MTQSNPWQADEWWPKVYGNCAEKECPCSAGGRDERGALSLFRYQFAHCTADENLSLLSEFEARWGHQRVHISWCSHRRGSPCQCKEVSEITEVAEHFDAWNAYHSFDIVLWPTLQARGLPNDVLQIVRAFWGPNLKAPVSDYSVCNGDCVRCVVYRYREQLATELKAKREAIEHVACVDAQEKIRGCGF